MTSLERFVLAQGGIYPHALSELRNGLKTSHWMWFVFPQIAGLGRSPTARRFAIRDLGEAHAYLGHDVLGPRLGKATAAVIAWGGRRTLSEIFGTVDAVKFVSCMTLFEAFGYRAVRGALAPSPNDFLALVESLRHWIIAAREPPGR